MSLDNIKYPKGGTYRSNKLGFEPIDLFLDLLPESKKLDLLLGYFSSTAIRTISKGFALFLFNGGEMRMVTNHIYASDDKQALLLGEKNEPEYFEFNLKDYEKIKDSLDDSGTHFFNCLAWLIAKKKLQIQIIKPYDSQGIAHYKSGLFDDGENRVSFSGSCNFTYSGLVRNRENITIKKSFTEIEDEKYAIDEFREEFDEIFKGKAEHLNYLAFSEIEELIQKDFGGKNIYELLEQEKTLTEKMYKYDFSDNVKEKLKILDAKIKDIIEEPRFPYEFPRDYQAEAYKEWRGNNCQGIFAMATGTGKTLTSLNCVLEQWKNEKVYRAVVIVPTITLVEQWEKEANSFNFKEIIKVSSKNKWTGELSTKLALTKRFDDVSFILIVTYASFPKKKFQSFFKRIPDNTILIADEGHNFASATMVRTYNGIHLSKRLCLSATPKRIYDFSGSVSMEQFFNDKEPYVYSFNMKRAIDEKILCEYYYYPHIVRLMPHELNDYKEISKELIQHFDFKKNEYKISPKVEILLMQRKRIIQKAENKLSKVINILTNQFNEKGNLKYTFLYVPEGFSYNYDNIEEISESDEGIRIIDQYTRGVSSIDNSILIDQFIGGTKNKATILRDFSEGKIHILASMKCLDEGVDIPRAEFAIFCSSTGNPRQFIQRRGRVLRKDKNNEKHRATIHDLVVIPDFQSHQQQEGFNIERNLVRKELERVMHFASLATNPYETDRVFSDVCNYYDLNIYAIKNKLLSI